MQLKILSLIVARSSGVRKSDRTIGNNFTSREIVRWIFNEGECGDVSNVFETDKSYMLLFCLQVKRTMISFSRE